MSIFSKKSSAFVLAAAVVGAMSMASSAALAGPPLVLKKPCIGCNPNTWTPINHNHWNGGYGGFSGGLSINLAQPVTEDEGDCYYVRRQVFIPQVGLVSKRQLVCN
jgi:opacity protein-like surface antigen